MNLFEFYGLLAHYALLVSTFRLFHVPAGTALQSRLSNCPKRTLLYTRLISPIFTAAQDNPMVRTDFGLLMI